MGVSGIDFDSQGLCTKLFCPETKCLSFFARMRGNPAKQTLVRAKNDRLLRNFLAKKLVHNVLADTNHHNTLICLWSAGIESFKLTDTLRSDIAQGSFSAFNQLRLCPASVISRSVTEMLAIPVTMNFDYDRATIHSTFEQNVHQLCSTATSISFAACVSSVQLTSKFIK